MDERSAPDGADSTTILATELLESLDTRPGATIAGRFRVESMLGRGGYGEVWRARQLRVDRVVALKLLRADVAHREDAARRFEREARLASRLSHPNAVRVIDFGEDRGTLFLAMDHIDGPTLRERLRERGALPWREAAWLTMRIAAALRAAHGLGLVHRDLKPANVLISRIDGEDQPVVIDFGLAKIFDDDAPDDQITRAHAMLGTPAYMCPEVVRGAPVDGRSDLYSLGVLLFELLTGRVPLRGATPLETATMHLHVAPPALGPLVPDAPQALVSLVERLLSKRPEGRPADADEVMATLAELLRAPAASGIATSTASDPIDATMLPTRRPAATASAAAQQPEAGQIDSNRSTDVRAAAARPGAALRAAESPATGAEFGRSVQPRIRAESGPAAVARARRAPLGVAAAMLALGMGAIAFLALNSGREAAEPTPAAAVQVQPPANDPSPALAPEAHASTPPTPAAAPGGTPVESPDPARPEAMTAALAAFLPDTPPPETPVGGLPGPDSAAAVAPPVADPSTADATRAVDEPAQTRNGGATSTGARDERRDEVAVGTLFVNADPVGTVEIEGFESRVTPVTFRDVPAGRYRVRIVNGPDVYEESVEVREGERATVRHNFRAENAPVRAEQVGAE